MNWASGFSVVERLRASPRRSQLISVTHTSLARAPVLPVTGGLSQAAQKRPLIEFVLNWDSKLKLVAGDCVAPSAAFGKWAGGSAE